MTGLAKQLLDHFADICERLEPPPGQDAMDRALVLFTVAVALGMAGNPVAEIRQRGPRLATEPIKPLDRETLAIEFEPQDAPTWFAQQLGADVDFPHFGATKARFQLDMTDDAVRLQHHVVSAPVDLTFQHLDITRAVPPHEGEELTKKEVTERLLALDWSRRSGARPRFWPRLPGVLGNTDPCATSSSKRLPPMRFP
jgi:hypothetical protein